MIRSQSQHDEPEQVETVDVVAQLNSFEIIESQEDDTDSAQSSLDASIKTKTKSENPDQKSSGQDHDDQADNSDPTETSEKKDESFLATDALANTQEIDASSNTPSDTASTDTASLEEKMSNQLDRETSTEPLGQTLPGSNSPASGDSLDKKEIFKQEGDKPDSEDVDAKSGFNDPSQSAQQPDADHASDHNQAEPSASLALNGDALAAALSDLQQLHPDDLSALNNNHEANGSDAESSINAGDPQPGPSLDPASIPVTPTHDAFSETTPTDDKKTTAPVLEEAQDGLTPASDPTSQDDQDLSLLNL